MKNNINLLVLPGMIDQLKRKYNKCTVTSSAYTSKWWTPVTLYKFYQQSDKQLVASLYTYKGKGSVLKDHVSKKWYTDSQLFV